MKKKKKNQYALHQNTSITSGVMGKTAIFCSKNTKEDKKVGDSEDVGGSSYYTI